MPKLSIIIPTFNSATSLEKCLRSVAVQTFRDYEIIVQDGGSSDETVDKIKKFQHANPSIDLKLFVEKDKGPYDAMNRGIRRAGGAWLYFLGSDDELHDSSVLSVVMAQSDGECDVLYGSVKVVGDSDWAKNNRFYDGVFDLKKLLNRNICHQAMFYRKKFLGRVGPYNLNYPLLADWDLNLRCWSKTDFKYIDVTVANYYAGGLSSRGVDECFNRDVASNVLRYFNLSLRNPWINSPSFLGYDEVFRMRESRIFVARMVSRFRRLTRSHMYD